MKLLDKQAVLVRRGFTKDIKAIAFLENQTIQNLCTDKYSKQEIQGLVDSKRGMFWDEIIFVAEREEKIVGFASLLSCRKVVGGIYVDQNFIRQGIGTKLLNAIEEEAIKRDIDILRVTSSLIAQPFYTALGYESIASCPLWKGDALIPGVAMRKKLTLTNIEQDFSFLAGFIPNVPLLDQ